MRKELLQIGVIFFSLGILMSGLQTVTGYYADPSGYGFQHLQAAYFYISIAMTLLGGIMLIKLIKRMERFLW
jgi:hypothetical protein